MVLSSEQREARNSILGTGKATSKGSREELLPTTQKVSWGLCSATRSRRGDFLSNHSSLLKVATYHVTISPFCKWRTVLTLVTRFLLHHRSPPTSVLGRSGSYESKIHIAFWRFMCWGEGSLFA
jgi:hypothetical protein